MTGARNENGPDIGLIVSHDRAVRDEILDVFRDEGVPAIVCPGPCGPSHQCLGDRDGCCPFIDTVTFVVLDAPTSGDIYGEGTTAPELVGRYRDAGRPVVALTASYDDARALRGDDVVLVRKPLNPRRLRDAVRLSKRYGPDAEEPTV